MAHVDIIQNDWSAGLQRRVASVYIGGGRVQVDTSDQAWRERLLRPIKLAEGDVVDPDETPELFLKTLGTTLHGSYFFATEPHSHRACPIPDTGIVPMRPVPASGKSS